MTALWIAHVTVTDAAAFAEYSRRAAPVIESHGGEYLSRGGASLQLEGAARQRHVVIRFPSLDAARACYEDPAYRDALSYAEGSYEREIVLVEENGKNG
ncbi:MAG: DUF1330 domain-containing protein [Paracoccus sp. (in: a-proteobacteria)]|nr:DUF1330 domain-containing protein [Paracoccus sp. (in: a-proteobacteria)]